MLYFNTSGTRGELSLLNDCGSKEVPPLKAIGSFLNIGKNCLSDKAALIWKRGVIRAFPRHTRVAASQRDLLQLFLRAFFLPFQARIRQQRVAMETGPVLPQEAASPDFLWS